ncbi:MAG TPA: Ig domain-containing protein, partial [Patescibacteria group bacterium]|nr:Ig domain-containing protein [Patescibacteria group bacterium]
MSARSTLEGVLFATSWRYTSKLAVLLFLVPLCLAAHTQKGVGHGRTKNSTLINTTSSPLPAGQVDSAYGTIFTAKGGVSPYSWQLSSGALPPGLSLSSSSGTLSGVPTQAGSYSFTIGVQDSGGQSSQSPFALSIAAPPPPPVSPLSVSTTSMSQATAGQSYSASLQATGGTSPYMWSLASGQLPAGLSLAVNGQISGTPLASGQYNFAIQVQDASSSPQTASASLSISVLSAPSPSSSPLTIITTWLPQAYVPQPYASPIHISGGTPGFTWSISSGQMPAGLTLSTTTGEISGNPSATGTFTFTVSVSDSSVPAQSASATFSMAVIDWPTLDQYGGSINAPAPGGGTGYFRVVKDGSRWMLVDPMGNLFWMVSSYVVDMGDGGAAYSTAVQNKYGGSQAWAAQATARLKSWGFNAIGPESGVGSHNVL